MNWTFPSIGFVLALFMGAALSAFLAQNRPGWSRRRRNLVAASVLPAITLLATLAGILFVTTSEHGQGENMEDLAVAALIAIGGGFALLAFVGGILGAALGVRRR